ncbi:HCL108Cp [Eremothecium sinecaudum]|uniref:HCL108Cp n=1 Tax=Eremothecium sinecaudum TaxID=45286 RepID=A0A109UZ06_9SACH|nr:HCL108Cp [Eremothecium sinecaudum]AMD20043.1 HCL108Cp [Eremothecium sinecaudum]
MQYVGRAIGSVTKSWSLINPATLSGAIDVIVVEHPDGELACSPFHVRFGKFQILKPSQKKVEVIVNDQLTNIPMKLGDSGEAYFVFETDSDLNNIPDELITSPVVSAASSPSSSPRQDNVSTDKKLPEPDFLDINDNSTAGASASTDTTGDYCSQYGRPATPAHVGLKETTSFEERINRKLNQKKIPSKLDNNGDLLLDIEGYKSSQYKVHDTDEMLKQLLQDELGKDNDISPFVKEDYNGNIRIINPYDSTTLGISPPVSPSMSSESLELIPSHNNGSEQNSDFTDSTPSRGTISTTLELNTGANYIKTIRLTSDQLRCLDLKYGENEVTFSVDKGKAVVNSKIFLWKWDVPIVISDIDGTITKSDALGHVMTMIGKDWTHSGVAKLFTEIRKNGYNIMYLTARSAGQADSTRSYLRSIQQGGCALPIGPVILSPDRTIAALRREVILKKPEVFKIACLNDIQKLYFKVLQSANVETNTTNDEQPTPFYAGFGNRITDALSYRTVGIPSSRIFTINPDGEVHMELLELTGLRSSYVLINELVDQFFPHVKQGMYFAVEEEVKNLSPTPGSPVYNPEERSFFRQYDEKFSDVNFWREPLLSVEDLSDITDDENAGNNPTGAASGGATTAISPPPSSSQIMPSMSLRDNLSADLGAPTDPTTLSSPDRLIKDNLESPSPHNITEQTSALSTLSLEQHGNQLPSSPTSLGHKYKSMHQDLSDEDYSQANDFTDDEFDEDEFDEDDFWS